ncbi:alpha/beta fold hydrolase [Cellulomonas edaphi]|uniref:Alpha/beta hydrolase n=1 Tax=Cellulomonas edaphi TaxID=3053468 RepID=A0ABT7S5D0_9CELL|nr:alpha/beta hydrolase [Cellulomons edaphi]MDM7830724.1 alpha/beta hydrolase [Cellulomons edaphi]
MTTPHRLPRPEGRVAYTVDGPDSAPLVLLVPGMGDLRSTWRDLTPALLDAGYRVAVTDLRGHGDSDTTFRTHGDEATASDVVALLEHLGGPAVLVGHSMGAGAVTLVAAERPDLVAGLVLSGPFLRDPELSRTSRAIIRASYPVLFARPWGARVWAGYYRKTLNRGRTSPWLDEHVADLRERLADPAHLRQFRMLCRQLTHAPVAARVGDVRAPALAFVGTVDPDFHDPVAEGAWIGEAIGAEVVMVPDAAHYPHHQAADVVVPRTLHFLAATPRDAAGSWLPGDRA